jgi:endonuclease YncB( thermonuclease family)
MLAVSIATAMIVTGFLCSSLTMNNGDVFAHRSGCHRYHSCPSDTGSYVCGDLGYDSQCPKKQEKSSSKDNDQSNTDHKTKSKSKTKATSCPKGYHIESPSNACLPNKVKQNNNNLVTSSTTNSTIFSNIKCQGSADCFEGTVTEVVDGDTLDVNNVRIRLALVNTPEINELGYIEAKQFVESNCGVGSHAKVDEDDGQKGGSFGRMIGLVYCGKNPISLNEALLNSSRATILQEFCSVSEFASKAWPVKYCSTNESLVASSNALESLQAYYNRTIS